MKPRISPLLMPMAIIFLFSCGGDDDNVTVAEDEFTFEGLQVGLRNYTPSGVSSGNPITIVFGSVINSEVLGVYYLNLTAEPSRFGGDNHGQIRIFLNIKIEEISNALEKTFEITKVIINENLANDPRCSGFTPCRGNYEGTGFINDAGRIIINYEGEGVGDCGDCSLFREFNIEFQRLRN